MKSGFEDNISTISLVSGVWFTFLTLGGFLGPLIAGCVYDRIGFQNTTLIYIVIHIFMFLLMMMYICSNTRGGEENEKECTNTKEKHSYNTFN